MRLNAERIGQVREAKDWNGGIVDHPSDIESSMLARAIRDDHPRLSESGAYAAAGAYIEARRARISRASPATAQHAPHITEALAQRGFSIFNSGGNTLSYTKHDPTTGSVSIVHGDGQLPLRMSDPVDVFFFGLQHSEPLLTLHFGTLSAFIRSIDSVDA